MNSQLLTTLLIFLESQAYFIIYATVFDRKPYAKWHIAWLITTVLMCLSNYLIAQLFVNGIVKSLLILLVNLAVSVIFYHATPFVRFYMVTFAYVLIVTADILMVVGYSYIPNDAAIFNSLGWMQQFLSFLPKFLVIFVLLALRKWFFTIRVSDFNRSTPIVFSIVLMLVNVAVVFQLASDTSQGIAAMLSAIGLLTMDLLLYHFLQQAYIQAREEYRNTLLEKQIHYQKLHFDGIFALYNTQKQFMHDYRNQMATIKQLLNDGQFDEAVKYVTSLSSDLIVQHYEFHTGHDVIDAILNIKNEEAKANLIKFTLNANDLATIKIRDVDLVCVLSNLLDNAIEASSQCPPENRKILVKLEAKNEYFTIAISNSIVEQPTFCKKTPVSSKKDSNRHGIGYLNILQVLKKYGADYEIYTTETTFQFVTMLKAT